MGRTLEYILDCAAYPSPVLQQSLFAEREDVDFAYLRRNGFLVENGRMAGSIMVFGEPVDVHKDRFTDEYYYWDSTDRETVDPKELTEYDVCYEPLARLLCRTYCDDEDCDCIVPNSLWHIGVPVGGNASVYLARNVGSNARVRDELGELPEEDTVLWFGKRPGRGITRATLVQLSRFLSWKNEAIMHKEQWPASLGTGGEARYRNAIILKGDYWEIWFDGGKAVQIESKLNGVQYIVRMIEAGADGLPAKFVAPPEVIPAEANVDGKELEYAFNGTDGDLPEYTDDELAQLRRDLAQTKAKVTMARNRGDNAEADRLQDIVNQFEKHINSKTRPGGKSVMATGQMKNITRRISSAIEIVCKRLEDDKHNRDDIAEHFRKFIEPRQTCRYTDVSRRWHIKY